MTKPEEAYAWWLTKEKQEGRIRDWYFERMTLCLTTGRGGHAARRMNYTPDFHVVMLGGQIRCVEIKGPYIREDSVIKFKMAAELFPDFEWQMIQIRGDGTAKVLRNIPARDGQKLSAPDGTAFETHKGGLPRKGDD